MKKTLVGAAAAGVSLVLLAAPVSAGRLAGTVIVTPDEVEVGGTVVVTNASDAASTCEPANSPEAEPSTSSIVDIEIEDPNGDLVEDEDIVPDTDGNWSFESDPLELVGEYTVIVWCQEPDAQNTALPSATPEFRYADAFFQVVAPEPTTTVAPSTTSTTAATAAVTATPHYTG